MHSAAELLAMADPEEAKTIRRASIPQSASVADCRSKREPLLIRRLSVRPYPLQ
jgi:hypothetical protein